LILSTISFSISYYKINIFKFC